jgi:hypothetical protein
MTILELPPRGDFTPSNRRPPGPHGADQPVQAEGGLLQFQLRRLIAGVLADPDLDPDMYVSLAGHVSEDPDHPERALLAHLRDVQDPDDLPPFKGSPHIHPRPTEP